MNACDTLFVVEMKFVFKCCGFLGGISAKQNMHSFYEDFFRASQTLSATWPLSIKSFHFFKSLLLNLLIKVGQITQLLRIPDCYCTVGWGGGGSFYAVVPLE